MSNIPVRKEPEPLPDRPQCQHRALGRVCFDEAVYWTTRYSKRLAVCEAHMVAIHMLALWDHVGTPGESEGSK